MILLWFVFAKKLLNSTINVQKKLESIISGFSNVSLIDEFLKMHSINMKSSFICCMELLTSCMLGECTFCCKFIALTEI